jgi:hypothetical protein
MQLDLFEEFSDVDILRKELAEIRQRNENVRKGIFARHNELARLYIELNDKVNKLEQKK